MPRHLGLCRERLLDFVADKLHESHQRFSVRDARRAVQGGQCSITFYRKMSQQVKGRREFFWACPETKQYPRRFDFVEESTCSLWDFDVNSPARSRRPPCRNVFHLRGFLHVQLSDGRQPSDIKLALGRNLQPHDNCDFICSDGNPVHPMLSITHCLWQYAECVLHYSSNKN